MLYLPIFPYWLWLCAKARSCFFFFAANPHIEHGGWDMESKYKIYESMKGYACPRTVLLDTKNFFAVQTELRHTAWQFPFYAKPDIGSKGAGVVLVTAWPHLQKALHEAKCKYMIQEPCKHQCELGIFYVRHPHTNKYSITGIVKKEPLLAVGDGKRTLLQIVLSDTRARMQIEQLEQKFGEALQQIPAGGEQVMLSSIGNHALGSKFVNITQACTLALQDSIHNIAMQIPEFYFGRLDVMCKSIDDAMQGGELEVVEVNGAGSEPTHLYDPTHSLWQVWRIIIKHWQLLYEVSAANKKRGHKYGTFAQGRAMFASAKKFRSA
jgi:hypothetical protein